MTSTSWPAIVIGLAVLVWLLYRQVKVRPVSGGWRLPGLLSVIGLVELFSYVQHHRLASSAVAVIVGSLVAGVLLGALRAMTVRIWLSGGQLVRQGTWLTIVLWLVSIGIHLAGSSLLHGAAATADLDATLLFLGVTLTAQYLVISARAGRGVGSGQAGPGQSGSGQSSTGQSSTGQSSTGQAGPGGPTG
jgi:hypothetical protein